MGRARNQPAWASIVANLNSSIVNPTGADGHQLTELVICFIWLIRNLISVLFVLYTTITGRFQELLEISLLLEMDCKLFAEFLWALN